MDDLIFFATGFFVAIVALCIIYWAVFAFVARTDRRNPFRDTRRNIKGRERMAEEWNRPHYMPEDWK